MIEFKNVSKTFYSKKKFSKNVSFSMNDISFKILDGETIGIIGKNGSGKSTLLRLLAGLINPDNGEILIDGFKISDNETEYKKKIGILFGGDVSLYSGFTAYENIEYFGYLNGVDEETLKSRILSYSKYFGMEDYINREVNDFSRGMKQKTSFVRSIIHNPQNIILDEPSTGLDIQAIKEVWEFVRFNQKNKKTILISSHNMDEIKKLCSKVIVLNSGKIAFFGKTKEIFNDDNEELLNKYLGVDYEHIQENL